MDDYSGRSCGSCRGVELIGDPGRIRTCDPQIRNLMLYPAELRGHSSKQPRISHCRLAN